MDERAPLPRAVLHPARGSVLVLAPHADDDVMGCGGTACLHVQQGDPVHVLVVFDGISGDPDQRFEPHEYKAVRRAEAHAGGAHLGLEHYEFWDYPEGHEPSASELLAAANRIAERIRALAPKTVYSPWVGEHHLDHHVLARAARLALELADFSGEAWGYEVWTPLVPTLIVDISHVFERKKAALMEHRSQLSYRDLVHMGLAVSAHRAIYLEVGARYGEGFAPLGEPAGSDRALLRAR